MPIRMSLHETKDVPANERKDVDLALGRVHRRSFELACRTVNSEQNISDRKSREDQIRHVHG